MGINNTLQRHFDDCRLPVDFIGEHPVQRVSAIGVPIKPAVDDFCFVDVAKRSRAEYFRMFVHPDAEMYLRDKRPPTRHLLLQMRCFPKNEHDAEVRNFLLGHDERQLFVVHPKAAETVQTALESLKPRPVMQAEMRGLKVIRQGDWFFIPLSTRNAPQANAIILTGETIGGVNARSLGITVGNPHIAEEQVITVRQWETKWGQVMRTVAIAVRGKIRHSEHSTIELRGWHSAVQNTMGLTMTTSIGYFD